MLKVLAKEDGFFEEELRFDPQGALERGVRTSVGDVVAAYRRWCDRQLIKSGLYGPNLMGQVRRWAARTAPDAFDALERGGGFLRRGRGGVNYLMGIVLLNPETR